ncbi:MAG: hypothetical protein JW885_09625 [Deltaproteobacteria bacterium]|nr:hypothetical protein [Candidatus Zymogenaceae bacterium]
MNRHNMMMIMVFLLSTTFVVETASAHTAYIDPGTTSVVFGAVGYIIAGLAAFFAIIFHPVKVLYRRIFKKDTENAVDAESPASPADDPK